VTKLRTGFTSKQLTLQDTINGWTDKWPQSVHADVRTVRKTSYCRFLPNSITIITLWTAGVHPAAIQWVPADHSNFTFTCNYDCTRCGVTAGDDTVSQNTE
jgi:hypothetical protein